MDDTIFSVSNEDLERVTPSTSVKFFRELLCAEAERLGVKMNLIDVPSEIDTPDGGIDAELKEGAVPADDGVIFKGGAMYQIKAKDFSLGQERNRKSLLLTAAGKLHPRIKECFDKGKVLAVVLFSNDSSQTKIWKEGLIELLPKEYKKCRIEFIQQNNLLTALRRYPALSLRMNGRGGFNFMSRKTWAECEPDLSKSLKPGENQQIFIGNLSEALQKKERKHIRVLGDAGIGKTRLVFEATAPQNLSSLVVYTKAEYFSLNDAFKSALVTGATNFKAILIVDECNDSDAIVIWNAIRPHTATIQLVTISNEFVETKSDEWSRLRVEPLPDEQVGQILSDYGMPKSLISRWAELCEGYPRFAHIVGEHLKDNPEELNSAPSVEKAMNRLIAGKDKIGSPAFEEKKTMLKYFSLFKKFGFAGPFKQEGEIIAELIHSRHPEITHAKCAKYIAELKKLKLIQGEFTLYITPKILHLRLWFEWWEDFTHSFDFEDFTKKFTPDLLRWFSEMFEYAEGSLATKRLAEEILAPGGPCDKDFFFENEQLVQFFRLLTPLSPKSALNILQKRLGARSRDDLLKLHTGRREIIYALSDIAVKRELFKDAAHLLLNLAEAENERWANNATGVFADLFTPAYGEYASSEAGPLERLPVLEEAIKSDSKLKRIAALKAFDVALESQSFSRIVSVHDNVFEKPGKRWTPATYGDIWNVYIATWNLLRSYVEKLPEGEKPEAANILLNNALGLGRIKKISPLIVETLEELAGKSYVGKKPVMEKIAWFLRYGVKDLPDKDIKKLWRGLEERLMDSSFSGRMQRYVGMNLLEDMFDDDGTRNDKNMDMITQLADESIKKPELLEAELSWLVVRGAANADIFGFQLGKKDSAIKMLSAIEPAFKKAGATASADLLCGYLRALNEISPKESHKIIQRYRDDSQLKSRLPEIIIRTGSLDDDSAKLILSLAQEGAVKIGDFRQFAFGRAITSLKEETVLTWVKWLQQQLGLIGISNGVDILWAYYLREKEKRQLPLKLTQEILMDERWLQVKGNSEIDKSYISGLWGEVATAFVNQHPDAIDGISQFILHNLGTDNTLFEGYDPDAVQVLDAAAKINPHKMWQLILVELESDDGKSLHPYRIQQWLRGQDIGRYGPGMSAMNPKDVFKWVEENPKVRAPLLASFVPKVITGPDAEHFCWARELLVRYGDIDRVSSRIHATFGSDAWSGPASEHYATRRTSFTQRRDKEINPNVIKWFDEEIQDLDEMIKNARIREERERF